MTILLYSKGEGIFSINGAEIIYKKVDYCLTAFPQINSTSRLKVEDKTKQR